MTKRTPQLESAILSGFAEGLSLSVACRRHDISRSAFLQWKAADPDLARRYEAAQLLHAESFVLASAPAPEPATPLARKFRFVRCYERDGASISQKRLGRQLQVRERS